MGGEKGRKHPEVATHENPCNKPFGAWETLTSRASGMGGVDVMRTIHNVSDRYRMEPARGSSNLPQFQGKETSKAWPDMRGSL